VIDTDQCRTIAIETLVNHLRGKQNNIEVMYPWRKGWQYYIHHSLRVELYAMEILKQEDAFTEKEQLLVRLTCILHDIGRLDVNRNHGEWGAQVLENLFRNGTLEKLNDIVDTQYMMKMVEVHSNKQQPEKDKLCAIIKNADSLDEIGAMSIFMAAENADRSSSEYFQQLAENLGSSEIVFCRSCMEKMNTTEGKRILEEKVKFIQQFRKQLIYEISGNTNRKQTSWV
jgi:uncharacterized protein